MFWKAAFVKERKRKTALHRDPSVIAYQFICAKLSGQFSIYAYDSTCDAIKYDFRRGYG